MRKGRLRALLSALGRVLFLNLARLFNQIQALGFRHGVKLDEWWGSAQLHESEQLPVMLRANVTYQVVLCLPLRLVAKSLWGTVLLKNSTAQTTGLYGRGADPGRKGPAQLFAV